jgi:DNA-3-methyladenine glycosylase II
LLKKEYTFDDPVILHLFKVLEPIIPVVKQDVYLSMLDSVVSQQLSIKVADVIFARFLNLFETQYPDAATLVQMDVSHLRSVGLSNSKASYLINIADFHLNKGLYFDELNQMTDEELLKYLTQIKGIGVWTAHMIMMFNLNREDVFPVGDLAIQNTMKDLYRLEHSGKPLLTELNKIAEKWRPYRSIASRYIWKWKDQQKKSGLQLPF